MDQQHNSGYIEESRHYFTLRVYYSDTDAGGVVYHSNYLNFAEHARTEMIDFLGGTQKHHMEKTGAGFVVSSIDIRYLKPGFLDDILTVETGILRCERFSLTMNQRILRDGDPLAEMKIKIAYVSLKTGRPLPLPEPWRTRLQELILA